MSTYRHTPRRVIVWIVLLGILLGVGYVWGDDLIRFATGQDILDDLVSDLARPPSVQPSAQQAAPGAVDQPTVSDERGPDGFPLVARRHVLKYTVQPGDSLFYIADRFGIHPNTIFWANTETLQDDLYMLRAGTELYILPVNGVYHTASGTESIAAIAARYGVTPGDILYSEFNTLSTYNSAYVPPAGLRIVVPGGRREYISWQAPIRTGTEVGQTNPEGSLHPGSCRELYNGAGGTGTYIDPVSGSSYRVTQSYALWHPGIDLAADPDTPIYAADGGVVVFAGWHRDGYGELVIIDHGGGWTTYYGHLARRYVDCGDQVRQGDYIGDMGLTGNASGIHLHFEIRQSDVPQDPARFIRFKDVRSSSGG